MHTCRQQMTGSSRRLDVLLVTLLSTMLTRVPSAQTAVFACAAGDVACLIEAMKSANANADADIIALEAGTYILTTVDNDTEGLNGLPSVTSPLSIQGAGAETTLIARQDSAPTFRLIHVAATGILTLEGLTLQGGNAFTSTGGGIRNNGGVLTFSHSILTGNAATGFGAAPGGGISNSGTLTVINSTLANNFGREAGGGLDNESTGTAILLNSTVANNTVSGRFGGAGGGVANSGTLLILNSTLVGNGPRIGGDGGGLSSSGTLTILNSTLARNQAGNGGGIDVFSGTVTLQNTLVALNTTTEDSLGGPDCLGPVTSLGNNLIGDPSRCTITLLPSDHTGDPGLGTFTDAGVPGRGHVPLLPESPAIDAGNPQRCPPTDQLGRPRDAICEIGAVEFQPTLAAFVTGFYVHALGRDPSPTEVADWMGFLQADPTVETTSLMIHAVFDGSEYRARPVTPWDHIAALYEAILGREPEPDGLEWWVEVMLDLLNTALPVFIDSPEFQRLVPDCREASAVTALVIRLYEEGLGRTPSADEVMFWPQAILTTCDLERAVEAFFNSEEYLEHRSSNRTVRQL